ncbi:hypothetical protein TNCV_358321 [Trichonephila clavipes]|nr:hypothetical protein TNCV_358321 [Trichonephila clavipes]
MLISGVFSRLTLQIKERVEQKQDKGKSTFIKVETNVLPAWRQSVLEFAFYNTSAESDRKKRISFASRQCKYTNTGSYGKTEIHNESANFLQPRVGTVRLFVVPKIEGDVGRSRLFNGCRSSGSRVQMNSQPTRIFLFGRNEEMDKAAEQMCSC